MTFDQRDNIWEVSFDTYYECYFEEMTADALLYRWSIFDDVSKWLIAITASSSAVSGWAVWNDPNFSVLWLGLSSLSAVLAITQSSLGIQQRIKNWESSKKSFVDLRLEFRDLRHDMSINPDFDIVIITKRLESLRLKYREQMSKLNSDTLRTRKLEGKIQDQLNITIADQLKEQDNGS